MEPKEFLKMALRYERSADEVERRTSIGRAYYAAFNHVRQVIEACGGVVDNAGAHGCVLYYLRSTANKGLPQNKNTHMTLSNLKTSRERADYEMRADVPVQESELAARQARTVIEQISAVPEQVLRNAIRVIPRFPNTRQN